MSPVAASAAPEPIRGPLRLLAAPHETLPPGTRLPFGWPAFPVTSDADAILAQAPRAGRLRLTVALEVWHRAELAIGSPTRQEPWVCVVVDHSDVLEVLDIPLPETAVDSPIRLRLSSGGEPIWLLADDANMPPEFRPHIISPAPDAAREARISTFIDRMRSLASLQQFGWKEGCVLEGLLDLAERRPDGGFAAAAEAHLGQFFDRNGELRYEDPWGRPADGQVYGVEGALPFAAIQRLWPAHPSLALLGSYLGSARRSDGAVFDEGMVSAEGAYTIAYPLAVLATARHDQAAVEDALAQLRIRCRELVDGDTVYLRSYQDGHRTYPNWIRAHTWLLLGLTRTLQLLPRGAAPDLAAELVRIAGLVAVHQQPDGLWRCYLDDPATAVETSGSAGIAAALTRGANAGLLSEGSRSVAERAWSGLLGHLTADGMLAGASQANKDGDRLQRADYRILSQMGMGLLAQLAAALDIALPSDAGAASRKG